MGGEAESSPRSNEDDFQSHKSRTCVELESQHNRPVSGPAGHSPLLRTATGKEVRGIADSKWAQRIAD